MRKIIVQEFITLDGVMQAPGGPEEDQSSGFEYGGWTAPYFHEADEQAQGFLQKHLEPADLLLGRKTYQIFANYWPNHSEGWPGINEVTKYAVSNSLTELSWVNSKLINGDVVAHIKELKADNGSVIKVIGSSNLAQTLFKHDLVDELLLMIFPVTLGNGKRLFDDGTIPAAFTLIEGLIATNGVIFAHFMRAGDVSTGTVGV